MVRAKKHLGQHFLKDEGIAERIVTALTSVDAVTPIVEIGPGTGVLTRHLMHLKQFNALDVDEESIAYLQASYPQYAEKFHLSDFLETDLKTLTGGPFNVIGNFPYNISSQIMFRVYEQRHQIPCVVGMFQKEVAERLASPPGSKVYGILSVLLQAFYDIEYLFTVGEHVFDPPPKVKSGVIRLKRNATQQLPCSEDVFKQVVKTTFNQRRKTIRNSIKPMMNGATFTHALLDKRPEQLNVSQFIELTVAAEKAIDTN